MSQFFKPFILSFLILGYSVASTSPFKSSQLKPDEVLAYHYLGMKFILGKSTQSGLIPPNIPYRFSRPYLSGVAQEVDFGSYLLFELSALVGYDYASGNPFYCLDCYEKLRFESTTRAMEFGIKYDVLKTFKNKHLWFVATYNRTRYQWNNNKERCQGRCTESLYLKNNQLDYSFYSLGLAAEAFFVVQKWYMLGFLIQIRTPLYTQYEYLYPRNYPYTTGKRIWPLLDFQLRLKI